MSSKRFSPTANLLRKSRLFSIPPVLARPSGQIGITGDAAGDTSPYPLQQAITTPRSSLARGDWGLKRAIPLKSTIKTSTPLIRVNALDTIEHITDFQSAADLALTLAKIQDLALPITTRPERKQASIFAEVKSVFEAETDHTDPKVTEQDPEKRRWKFQGPWLVGMSEGDFLRYVAKELRGRKAEFAAFLREHHTQMLEQSQSRDNSNEDAKAGAFTDAGAVDPSFGQWMRKLRSNFSPASELSRLITRFLDLPESHSEKSGRGHFSDYAETLSEHGPPKTHPSAGLSYLKTNAIVANHPLLGPQASPTPVEARVLRARSGQVRDPTSRLGVAGLVVGDGLVQRQRVSKELDEGIDDRYVGREQQGNTVGVATPGGNRIWVQPMRANIDEHGRAQLVANSATQTAVGIHTGELIAPQTSWKVSTGRNSGRLPILDKPAQRRRVDGTDKMVSELGNILSGAAKK